MLRTFSLLPTLRGHNPLVSRGRCVNNASRSRGALRMTCEQLQPRPRTNNAKNSVTRAERSGESNKPRRENASNAETRRTADGRNSGSSSPRSRAMGGKKKNRNEPVAQKSINSKLPPNPSVAIIGGGISGLTCAKRLR
eukprot:2821197-Pyramimonas_sp.AAC.1